MVEAHSILANKTIGGGCYIRPQIPARDKEAGSKSVVIWFTMPGFTPVLNLPDLAVRCP